MSTTTVARPAYVRVGQCSRCKLGWRTNLSGELRAHASAATRCDGSRKPPINGRCAKCDLTWPVTAKGQVERHKTPGANCKGSSKPPLVRAVVLAELYRPGEKWPKKRM